MLTLTLLCSCRSTNENNNLTSSNKSNSASSDLSSTISDVLPDRDLPDDKNSDTTNSSDNNSTNSENDVPEQKVSLSIETTSNYFRSSVKTIGLTLYNKNKNIFTYQTDFFLQYYTDDGKWEYVETKNGEIEYKYNTAETKSYIEKVYFDLRTIYDLPLPYGTYRVILQNGEETIASNSFQIVEDSFFDGYEQ